MHDERKLQTEFYFRARVRSKETRRQTDGWQAGLLVSLSGLVKLGTRPDRDGDSPHDARHGVGSGEGLSADRDERDSSWESVHPTVIGSERVISRQDDSRIGIA